MGNHHSNLEKDNKVKKHVIFCSAANRAIQQRGRQAEFETVQYLLDNLTSKSAGDYRILFNYNLAVIDRGSAGTLEIDAVLINRHGIFLLEVKDWQGSVEAYDGYWLQSGKYRHTNVFDSIEFKARVLSSQFFGHRGSLADLGRVPVISLIVLVRGLRNFHNHSRYDARRVVDLEGSLVDTVSMSQSQARGGVPRQLTDDDIRRISDALFNSRGEGAETLVGTWRVFEEASPGELYDAFEAVHIDIPTWHARIKRYQLYNIGRQSEAAISQFRRDAIAVHSMGNHPNIVQTYEFFKDSERDDVYFEVTELIDGERLDEVLGQLTVQIPFGQQLRYLRMLCLALQHAHRRRICHRNLSPETVFITRDHVVKLADFDFAKISGMQTISVPGEVLVENPYTAPEVLNDARNASAASDIYSLGMLWIRLASQPKQSLENATQQIGGLAIPQAGQTLLRRMLRRVPAERPQSIEEILDALTEVEKQDSEPLP